MAITGKLGHTYTIIITDGGKFYRPCDNCKHEQHQKSHEDDNDGEDVCTNCTALLNVPQFNGTYITLYLEHGTNWEELDNCEVCFGKSGGVCGNENIVDGVVMCDYCTAKDMNKKKNGEK